MFVNIPREKSQGLSTWHVFLVAAAAGLAVTVVDGML